MSTALSPLLAPMLSSAAMRAICDDVAYLRHMLDFEAALARAEAAAGIIPDGAAEPIASACNAEAFDLAVLAKAATSSGNLAIPLVKALTEAVADVARMRANLDTTHGLIVAEAVTFALAEKIGKREAHHLVEAASKKAVPIKKDLRGVLAGDPRITAQLDVKKLADLFEPMAYQGASQALIDRLLASLDT